MTDQLSCQHLNNVINLDLRVGYGEVSVQHEMKATGSSPAWVINILDYDQEDPEDIEFPSSVTGLGIFNKGNSSSITVGMRICADCRRVL